MAELFEPFAEPAHIEAPMRENEEARPFFTQRVEELAAIIDRRKTKNKGEAYELIWNDIRDAGSRDLTADEIENLRSAVDRAYSVRHKNKQTSAAKQVMAGRIPRGSTKENRLKALYGGLTSSGPMEADRRRSDTLLREAEERELNQE